MKKFLLIGLFTIVFSVIWNTGYSDEHCSVSGEIAFYRQAPIYISIYSYENFSDFKNSLPPKNFHLTVNPSPDQIKAGRLDFEFPSVPKGTYCIFAFQDLDGDVKVKSSVYGYIDEPYEFYKKWDSGLVNWERVKFELSGNLNGIVMKLHN